MSHHQPPPQPILAKASESTDAGAASVRPGPRRRGDPSPPRAVDPDSAVDTILRLLGEERYRTARRLAAETIERFPDHPRVRNAWAIFDHRGKARVAPGAPEPSTAEEFEWLSNPPDWARGKWVALIGRQAVATADTLAELTAILRSKKLPQRPLVHRIDAG